MIKKKLNILLLLLLVVLFTSLLGTISYANVDANEIKNWILNSYCYNYETNEYDETKIQDVLTFISNHEQDIQNIATASSQYNNTFLYGFDNLAGRPLNTNISYWVFDGEMYSPGDGNYIYFDQVKLRGTIRISNNTFTSYSTGGGSASGYSSTWQKYYSDTPIYNSNTYENIRYPSGTYPSGLLSSPYFNNDYFIYAPSSLVNEIDLNNTYYFSDTAQVINFVRDMERKHKRS